MNRTIVHWLVGDKLPEHIAIIEAVPGVGNVGKLIVDGLIKKHPSRTLAWILHPDLPPHAVLGEKGLILPPRIEINSVLLPNNCTIITIGGNLQPMTAAGQFEVSEEILKIANKNNTPQLLVLAGLAAGLEDKHIHVICSDEKIKRNLEGNDIEVSKDQPKEGIIGIAGLIVSLSPIYKVPTVGLIAETVGASADILAANRMAEWIDAALNIPLDLDLDTTGETAKKIMERMKTSKSIDDLLSSEENEVSSDFYV